MINTTDLAEFEVLLPGTWVRSDSDEVYTFTTDEMKLEDDRLYKELYITGPKEKGRRSLPYAVTIEDDYCGICRTRVNPARPKGPHYRLRPARVYDPALRLRARDRSHRRIDVATIVLRRRAGRALLDSGHLLA